MRDYRGRGGKDRNHQASDASKKERENADWGQERLSPTYPSKERRTRNPIGKDKILSVRTAR